MLRAETDRSTTLGIASSIGANVMWGLVPLYYQLLTHVPVLQTTTYRVVLSLPMLALLVWLLPRQAERAATPKWVSLVCGVLIGINWLLFVYLVVNGRAMEASLAYFVTPLAIVAVGVVLFGERMDRKQTIAIVLAAAGCVVFALDSLKQLDRLWPLVIAFLMAAAVAAYTTVRRRHDVPGVEGVFREVVVLTPAALVGLIWFGMPPVGESGSPGVLLTTLYLAGAAVFTVAPLSLFGFATTRLPMRVLGFIQYLGPSMQLGCSLALGQKLTPTRLAGFGLIWAALVVFTVASSTSRRGKSSEQS
ncbi:MAG: EamA family transporter RarD [Planctomycetota bacterium]